MVVFSQFKENKISEKNIPNFTLIRTLHKSQQSEMESHSSTGGSGVISDREFYKQLILHHCSEIFSVGISTAIFFPADRMMHQV
jgi:hypothetical protein